MSLALFDEIGVSPNHAVVDVGGGASHLVDALIDAQFGDVTVVDISAVALKIAQRRLGEAANRVTWLVENVSTWRPARQWDVWHDRAVFHFMVTPATRARYLRALAEGLTLGGIVVLATFAADGPESCSGLPVSRYDPDDLARVLDDEGHFDVLAMRRDMHTTPWGDAQPFSWLAARRIGRTVQSRSSVT